MAVQGDTLYLMIRVMTLMMNCSAFKSFNSAVYTGIKKTDRPHTYRLHIPRGQSSQKLGVGLCNGPRETLHENTCAIELRTQGRSRSVILPPKPSTVEGARGDLSSGFYANVNAGLAPNLAGIILPEVFNLLSHVVRDSFNVESPDRVPSRHSFL